MLRHDLPPLECPGDALAERYPTCEKCGCQYEYAVSGTGKGEAIGMRLEGLDAREEAHDLATAAALRTALAEPAACPNCGWYQRDMVAELRRRHLALRPAAMWLLRFGGGATLFGIYFLLDAGPDEIFATAPLAMAAGCFAVAGILFAAHLVESRGYEPNAAWPQRPPPRRGEPKTVRLT